MEKVMSTTFGTPTTREDRRQARSGGLVAVMKKWWSVYLTRRIERTAIIQLHAMSDRELQDIGLTRSRIERAVSGERDHRPFTRHY
jgi:uncharacterized protein YjiS (DUF1127 family)